MTLYWMIDSKECLFTADGEGDVTFDDAIKDGSTRGSERTSQRGRS
jgi:hypothetical protein